MKQCAICDRHVEAEDAPILTMGAYGNPKYLCDECAEDLDIATLGKEYDEILAAMDRIGKRMSDFDPDGVTYKNVSAIMERAAERAKQIKAGTYDFALDEAEDEESFDEIPEELLETEEDKELDKRDEEKQKRFDAVFNWISFGAIIGALGFLVYKILDTYVF